MQRSKSRMRPDTDGREREEGGRLEIQERVREVREVRDEGKRGYRG